jgi:hypothetical protein
MVSDRDGILQERMGEKCRWFVVSMPDIVPSNLPFSLSFNSSVFNDKLLLDLRQLNRGIVFV